MFSFPLDDVLQWRYRASMKLTCSSSSLFPPPVTSSFFFFAMIRLWGRQRLFHFISFDQIQKYGAFPCRTCHFCTSYFMLRLLSTERGKVIQKKHVDWSVATCVLISFIFVLSFDWCVGVFRWHLLVNRKRTSGHLVRFPFIWLVNWLMCLFHWWISSTQTMSHSSLPFFFSTPFRLRFPPHSTTMTHLPSPRRETELVFLPIFKRTESFPYILMWNFKK